MLFLDIIKFGKYVALHRSNKETASRQELLCTTVTKDRRAVMRT